MYVPPHCGPLACWYRTRWIDVRLEEAFKREGAKASFEQVEIEWRTLGAPRSPSRERKTDPVRATARLAWWWLAGEVQYKRTADRANPRVYGCVIDPGGDVWCRHGCQGLPLTLPLWLRRLRAGRGKTLQKREIVDAYVKQPNQCLLLCICGSSAHARGCSSSPPSLPNPSSGSIPTSLVTPRG